MGKLMEVRISLADLRVLEQTGSILLKAIDDLTQVRFELVQPKHQATGAEIREFFDQGWDMDYYHEGDYADVQLQDDNGKWLLFDEVMYDLSSLGDLCWQGMESAQSKNKPEGMTFEEAFLKWKGTK